VTIPNNFRGGGGEKSPNGGRRGRGGSRPFERGREYLCLHLRREFESKKSINGGRQKKQREESGNKRKERFSLTERVKTPHQNKNKNKQKKKKNPKRWGEDGRSNPFGDNSGKEEGGPGKEKPDCCTQGGGLLFGKKRRAGSSISRLGGKDQGPRKKKPSTLIRVLTG